MIVAPLRVIYNVWPDEIAKWGYDLSYQVLHGPKKAKALGAPADVYLVNPEGLKCLAEAGLPDAKVLIVDESTMFRNHSSKRFNLGKFDDITGLSHECIL